MILLSTSINIIHVTKSGGLGLEIPPSLKIMARRLYQLHD